MLTLPDNDQVFFFNYRSDRVREITQLLGDVDRSPRPDFSYPKNITLTTMTQYKLDYPFEVAFTPQRMGNVLAETLGSQGVNQVHVAETEKYAHVTFFFNGGVEKVFPLEIRDERQDLVPSNKSVATYDKAPEMSAAGVAKQVCKRVEEGKFEFVMNNFAPPDMVGHTGVYEAALVGVAATDKGIGEIYETCKKEGYILFITSDHGYGLFQAIPSRHCKLLIRPQQRRGDEIPRRFAQDKPHYKQGTFRHGQRSQGLVSRKGGRRRLG